MHFSYGFIFVHFVVKFLVFGVIYFNLAPSFIVTLIHLLVLIIVIIPAHYINSQSSNFREFRCRIIFHMMFNRKF